MLQYLRASEGKAGGNKNQNFIYLFIVHSFVRSLVCWFVYISYFEVRCRKKEGFAFRRIFKTFLMTHGDR